MLYLGAVLGQNSFAMIVGIGVDIAEVARLRQAIERHGERFLHRVFTPLEISYCQRHRNRYDRFAARFAAKEAAMKALGTGWRRGISWRDLEVINAPSGKPSLNLTGRAQEIFRSLGGTRVLLSLTHTDDYALAQVIIEGDGAGGA
ncbi:MAG TPA: holo-ACP synthase [Terriglobia bacterium]